MLVPPRQAACVEATTWPRSCELIIRACVGSGWDPLITAIVRLTIPRCLAACKPASAATSRVVGRSSSPAGDNQACTILDADFRAAAAAAPRVKLVPFDAVSTTAKAPAHSLPVQPSRASSTHDQLQSGVPRQRLGTYLQNAHRQASATARAAGIVVLRRTSACTGQRDSHRAI